MAAKKTVEIDDSIVGEITAEPVTDAKGRTLIGVDVALTKLHVSRLLKFGVEDVVIVASGEDADATEGDSSRPPEEILPVLNHRFEGLLENDKMKVIYDAAFKFLSTHNIDD